MGKEEIGFEQFFEAVAPQYQDFVSALHAYLSENG